MPISRSRPPTKYSSASSREEPLRWATDLARAAVAQRAINGHVSSAMLTAMGENLKRRTQKEVDAAMVILAARQEVTVEAKVQPVHGGAPWTQAAMAWAVDAGWMSHSEAQETIRKAEPAIIPSMKFADGSPMFSSGEINI